MAKATAVVSDAWQYPGKVFDPWIPDLIERDRVIMAARPGMQRKLLPIRIDSKGVFSGGCYLFDTYENAQAFSDWVTNDFVLDDTHFFDRGAFLEPTGSVWHIVGMEDFADVHDAQDVMRFERWHVGRAADVEDLRERHWPDIQAAAQASRLASAWLLYDSDRYHPQIGVVTVATRRDGGRGVSTADEAVQWLEAQPSLGDKVAEDFEATKVFDRTSWIYVAWFHVGTPDDEHPIYPNSPPLPVPSVEQWAVPGGR